MSRSIDVRDDERRLAVVGFVYLELFLPPGTATPAAGEEVFVEGLGLGVGGALNAASVARALGTATTLSYPRPAGPFADVARRAAKPLGIDCRTWPTGSEPPVSVVLSGAGDRSFLSRADFEAFDDGPELPGAAWLLVAGLREARRLGGRLAAARARGGRVCVNACWAPEELDRLAAGERPWDLLILNEREAERAAGGEKDPLATLTRAVPEVVITRGARGSAALLGGARVEVPAATAPAAVDATGTGDAFCAGLLHARLRGAQPAAALAFASEVAARVLGVRGGAVRDPSLFDDLETTW